MKRKQQQQILKLLNTIEEAQLKGMYFDCHDAALAISQFIDNVEGRGTKTVSLFEEYRELLLMAINGNEQKEQLYKQLSIIEGSIKCEFNPRIEIAFLSYKASMSDSLESIYLAAKSNPNCDAYWIPIPYYDKNADGSLGTMHYEGAEHYDENFEITDWKEYNIESRNPDIIFTFAPYDDLNRVTMVHPDFHCKRLCKLTNLLCYVSYFVHAEGDDVAHYPLLNGILHSHLVFVQSASIRHQYIETLHKASGVDKEFLENKIIALGSPKFDKVISSKESNYCIPDEWRKIIGNKKVILYNTTIGVFLQNPEQYIKKSRSVFEFFKTCKSTILIWRPHPLLEQTVLSMRPDLYNAWKVLLDFFVNRNCGIFDDSSNMYQAINISDGYYGDSKSSVEVLYRATNKPILIQDLSCRVYADSECSGIDLSVPAFLESNNQIRIADFVDKLDEITVNNDFRKQKFLTQYTNADGTSGEKILDYVLSQFHSN